MLPDNDNDSKPLSFHGGDLGTSKRKIKSKNASIGIHN